MMRLHEDMEAFLDLVNNQIYKNDQRISFRYGLFTTGVKSDHCSIRNARMSRTDGGNHDCILSD